jgi:hypothetical protein
MQNNHVNLAFNQLPLEAFSLDGQVHVKGAHRADLCVRLGIYKPLTGNWSSNNFANKVID